MGIENTDTLDMVVKSLDGVENGLDLIIVDSGTVEDEVKRYSLLVDKLATYVNFVMSDDFARENPNTVATQVLIRVLCKTPPNEAMQQVTAVYPRGDRVNRVRVVFEDVEEFKQRMTLQ